MASEWKVLPPVLNMYNSWLKSKTTYISIRRLSYLLIVQKYLLNTYLVPGPLLESKYLGNYIKISSSS